MIRYRTYSPRGTRSHGTPVEPEAGEQISRKLLADESATDRRPRTRATPPLVSTTCSTCGSGTHEPPRTGPSPGSSWCRDRGGAYFIGGWSVSASECKLGALAELNPHGVAQP